MVCEVCHGHAQLITRNGLGKDWAWAFQRVASKGSGQPRHCDGVDGMMGGTSCLVMNISMTVPHLIVSMLLPCDSSGHAGHICLCQCATTPQSTAAMRPAWWPLTAVPELSTGSSCCCLMGPTRSRANSARAAAAWSACSACSPATAQLSMWLASTMALVGCLQAHSVRGGSQVLYVGASFAVSLSSDAVSDLQDPLQQHVFPVLRRLWGTKQLHQILTMPCMPMPLHQPLLAHVPRVPLFTKYSTHHVLANHQAPCST